MLRRKGGKIHKADAVDVETGQMMSLLVYSNDRISDDSFVKVYKGDWYKGLSLHGYRMLFYVINKMRPNRLEVDIECTEYVAETGCSKNDVYSGIRNLMDCGLLDVTEKRHRYKVNTKCLFNGKNIMKKY